MPKSVGVCVVAFSAALGLAGIGFGVAAQYRLSQPPKLTASCARALSDSETMGSHAVQNAKNFDALRYDVARLPSTDAIQAAQGNSNDTIFTQLLISLPKAQSGAEADDATIPTMRLRNELSRAVQQCRRSTR